MVLKEEKHGWGEFSPSCNGVTSPARMVGRSFGTHPTMRCPRAVLLSSLSPAGGSLASDAPGDPELYVRWLQIVTFLPVMAFSTPPWLCCDAWVCTPMPCGGGHGVPYMTNTPKKPLRSLLGKAKAKNLCPVLATHKILLPAPATRSLHTLSSISAAKFM